ncbi:MAG: hypothetical protein IPP07_14840 [Holophagales bacterium]|nr:hypothetical protein [Holophagales bacterium]
MKLERFEMKKTLLVAFATLLVSGMALGQGAPVTGTAAVTLTGPATVQSGLPFTVDVNVNLTGVTGTCGGSVPAVLGGYVVPVGFPIGRATFTSSAGCTSAEFGAPLDTTPVAAANASGIVAITDSHANSSAPTGSVCVAQLTFTASGPGVLVLTPNPAGAAQPLQLSSAFQAGCPTTSPTTIPFTVAPFTINVTEGNIPTLSFGSLLALTAALAAAGLWAIGRGRF